MIHLTLLTSSRADIGIYAPFIDACIDDDDVDMRVIAFGSHIAQGSIVELDKWKESLEIIAVDISTKGDDVSSMIQHSVDTITQFDRFWKSKDHQETNVVICLGDRFEMFAAVQVAFAYHLPIAHFFGGETTMGANDEVYRHCISHMSDTHFTTHPVHSHRLKSMLVEADIHSVGSLSLDNIQTSTTLSDENFEQRYGIDIRKRPVLVTFHPVTRDPDETIAGLDTLSRFMLGHTESRFLITMPNIDPGNTAIRDRFKALGDENSHIDVTESLGKEGYFKAMSSCSMMIGNSSSALLESASFGIYAVNMGSRQQGRTSNRNVVHIPCELEDLNKAYSEILASPLYQGGNEFHNPEGAALAALRVLKNKYG